MLVKVKELIKRPFCYKVTFTYESYGNYELVSCTVNKPYIRSLGVRSLGKDDEDSLNLALSLLDEVTELEKKIASASGINYFTIEKPSLDKQPYVDGYYREKLFEEYEVEFKRTPDSYVITGITRKDENGFYYADRELDNHYFKMDKDEFYGVEIAEYKKLLKEGETLYAWDSIRSLSGSAGVVIVKDGRVIKTKGLAMA